MESKPDRSESVLLQTTPGPLWDVMDEHPCPPPPPPLTLFSFHLPPHPDSALLDSSLTVFPALCPSVQSSPLPWLARLGQSFKPNGDLATKN